MSDEQRKLLLEKNAEQFKSVETKFKDDDKKVKLKAEKGLEFSRTYHDSSESRLEEEKPATKLK